MAFLDSKKRVQSLSEIQAFREKARTSGETIVLTNGCFDILHTGHFRYLEESAALGDRLIVAVNSDASVRELKGDNRPINTERDRALAIASLRCVDAVVIFRGPRLANEILAISPDIYTKAGDYTPESLEATEKSALKKVNASIRIIPFIEGHSTTSVIRKMNSKSYNSKSRLSFHSTLEDLAEVIAASAQLELDVSSSSTQIVSALRNGAKLLTCGNGGSAADALHLAEELVGRYRIDRKPLPAICLNSDCTSLTCIANDYGYEQIFSRQVEALGKPGDVLICFTTSGNSANVIAAICKAKELNIATILLSGKDGGNAKGLCDIELIVPSNETARIQEMHTVVLHQWLEHIDDAYTTTSE